MKLQPLLVIATAMFTLFGAQAASAMYHPGTGRFMQRDPNGTQITPTALKTAGLGYIQRDRDPHQQYADGMNLYQYVRSNPIQYSDPVGLAVHLWPFNGEVDNQSKTATVTIKGDYVKITGQSSNGISITQVVFYPHTQISYSWYMMPRPTILYFPTATALSSTYALGPGKNSWAELKAGNTRIVDVDFVTGATVPVFLDEAGTQPATLPHPDGKVGWGTIIIKDTCDGNGVYID